MTARTPTSSQLGILGKLRSLAGEIKAAPIHNKIGLGIGVTGLGLSIANYRNNAIKQDLDIQRASLDSQSLSALQKIHKALMKQPKPVVIIKAE